MISKRKNSSILNYFSKQRKEAEAEISIPTSLGLAQSNETSTTQPENNLNKSKIGCDDIALILPPNIATRSDQLHMLKNAFRPIGEAAATFDFRQCCTAKGTHFRYLNENHFKTYPWLVYSESKKGLFCKYCATFSSLLVNNGVGKNCRKPGKLVTEPLCAFNKLTGSNGYLFEHDKVEYHKSMIIEVSHLFLFL